MALKDVHRKGLSAILVVKYPRTFIGVHHQPQDYGDARNMEPETVGVIGSSI
ncbi:hypothetical protein ZHAS_00003702 [Anopheles sinensis]|uniref:Uncharacterized protein n=1 Tax=Anopheles sinensis TaxID=74873 RepID=A0A084VF00_ANOSI|nr:hypothetical protein ZHAS_00003702 [Anopheles sinensis]